MYAIVYPAGFQDYLRFRSTNHRGVAGFRLNALFPLGWASKSFKFRWSHANDDEHNDDEPMMMSIMMMSIMMP